MPAIHVSESLEIAAPAARLYDIIADYRNGHPRILPPEYFNSLTVEAGGRGAGTRIRFEMRAFGKINTATAEITEPVPGRELRETVAPDIVTTFLVEPVTDAVSRVTITTAYFKAGWRGWIERVAGTRYLRRVYAAELAQLAQVATS
jgi:hypothetical protein